MIDSDATPEQQPRVNKTKGSKSNAKDQDGQRGTHKARAKGNGDAGVLGSGAMGGEGGASGAGAKADHQAQRSRLVSTTAINIKIKQVEWLWHCRIALGKLTLLAGRGGKGKSQITAMVAAAVTRGTTLPDGQVTPKGRVLILSAEDDAQDTIVPRLIAAGADMSMVEIIDGVRTTAKNIRPFMLTEDLVELTKMIEDFGDVKLIIIDPVSAYLGKLDDYNNLQLRWAMVPFVAAVAKYRAGVILVTHLNKNVNLDLIDRIMGSAAYSNLARAAMIVDEEDGVRFLVVPKINNAKEPARLNYSIEEMTVEQAGTKVDTSKIVMTLAPKGTVVNKTPRRPGPVPVKVEEAVALLRHILKDGPEDPMTVDRMASAEGLSEWAIRKARRALGVQFVNRGGRYLWSLPPTTTTTTTTPPGDDDDVDNEGEG